MFQRFCPGDYRCHNKLRVYVLSKKKGITIIGINFRDDEDNFKEWINEHGNPFEYILRDDGTIAYEMGLIGVPETFFIINKMTQKKIQGPLFYEDVEKYL